MKLKIISYNGYNAIEEEFVMPKKKVQLKNSEESFGRRLSQLRHAAGYTQRELAVELGISYRMVAYYETEAARLPIHLLPLLAKSLGVSVDELMGLEKAKKNSKRHDSRLWRRLSQVEKLPPNQRRMIIQFIDTFIEKEKLKARA